MNKIFVCLALSFALGCVSAAIKSSNEIATKALTNDAEHLKDIAKSKAPLNTEQKAMINDAIDDLKACAKTMIAKDVEIEKLQGEITALNKKLVSASQNAGAGKMAYTIIALLSTALVSFVVLKILGKLPF